VDETKNSVKRQRWADFEL